MHFFIGLLHFLFDWVLHFGECLVKFAEICYFFISNSQIFVILLVKLFEIIFIFVVIAYEFDVESSDVGDEEVFEDLVHFSDRNFLNSFL